MSDDPIFGNQTEMQSLDARLRRMERTGVQLRRGSRISSAEYSVLDINSVDSNVGIDTSGSDVLKVGSVPPTTNNAGWAATSTSGAGAGTANLHIYFDGTNGSSRIIIERADSSRFVVPKGDIEITGLDPSTVYYFLPFWPIHASCSVGWVQGTIGSPRIAFTANTDSVALARQGRQDREPLTSGYMSFTTAAGGGSSTPAPGGGGRDGLCVMHGTEIVTLGGLPYKTHQAMQREWVRIQAKDFGRVLNCTPDHPLYNADAGKIPAAEFKPNDWIITKDGERRILSVTRFMRLCTKVQVSMKDGHLFWANGFLSHNMKNNSN